MSTQKGRQGLILSLPPPSAKESHFYSPYLLSAPDIL